MTIVGDTSGNVNCLQNRVLYINPMAFFVLYNIYSLNLVVNDAAKFYLEATTFFNLVLKVYNYFSASMKRSEAVKQTVSSSITSRLKVT